MRSLSRLRRKLLAVKECQRSTSGRREGKESYWKRNLGRKEHFILKLPTRSSVENGGNPWNREFKMGIKAVTRPLKQRWRTADPRTGHVSSL